MEQTRRGFLGTIGAGLTGAAVIHTAAKGATPIKASTPIPAPPLPAPTPEPKDGVETIQEALNDVYAVKADLANTGKLFIDVDDDCGRRTRFAIEPGEMLQFDGDLVGQRAKVTPQPGQRYNLLYNGGYDWL